jgi:hypothetical protein
MAPWDFPRVERRERCLNQGIAVSRLPQTIRSYGARSYAL